MSSLFLPILLQEGVEDIGWPQKESKTTLHHDLYRHLYRPFLTPLTPEDTIILCSLSENTKVDKVLFCYEIQYILLYLLDKHTQY